METPPTHTRKVPRAPMAWAPPVERDLFALPHACQWLAHIEAGRIGGNPPMSERHRAQMAAQERQFRRLFAR